MIEGGLKFLPATRLIELLNTLPEGTLVAANLVGNLSLLDAEKHLGFIDFIAHGEIELYDQESP